MHLLQSKYHGLLLNFIKCAEIRLWCPKRIGSTILVYCCHAFKHEPAKFHDMCKCFSALSRYCAFTQFMSILYIDNYLYQENNFKENQNNLHV